MGLHMQHDLQTGHGRIAGMQITKTWIGVEKLLQLSTRSSKFEFELCASPEVKSDIQQRCFSETGVHAVNLMFMRTASNAHAAATCKEHYTTVTAYAFRNESDIQERCFIDTCLHAVDLMFVGKASNAYAAPTCRKQ